MKPYPEYKTTGLPWLPKIPKHWEIMRNKNVLIERKDVVGGESKNYRLLSLTLQGIILRDMDILRGKFPAEFDSYKIVCEGDIVFCLFDIDETPRTVGISSLLGMITGAYDVFWVRGAVPRFLYYYYLSIDNKKALKPYYTGLRKVIKVDTFLGMKLPIPPLDEQAKIVRYLDVMTAKIDKLIAAKKEQIALLQEKKQAVVNQAVTRGLNPEVELKDSGIDWLGKIPKHWAVNKTGHMFFSTLGKMLDSSPSSEEDSLESYICAKDVHFSGIDTSDLKQMWFSKTEKSQYLVRQGDLLIVEGGAGAGGAAVYRENRKCYIQNSIHLVRPKSKFCSVDFLYYWLCAIVGRNYIPYACNKATIPHFTKDKLFEMPFPILPVEEQQMVVSYLGKECEKFDKLQALLEKEISLCVEHKNSLISNIVSGGIGVCRESLN